MRDSIFNTFKVAISLCFVCSVLVSGAAVGLRSIQEKNKEIDKKKNILIASKLTKEGETLSAAEVETLYKNIKEVYLSIEEGKERPRDVENYDPIKAASDPATSLALAPAMDIAKIKRIAKEVVIYKVFSKSGELETLVLPIYGKGLWSTLYGFLAVSADGRTVKGITYYQHAETPGLGGEVDNPNWKGLWPGRKIYDEEGKVALRVIKGKAGSVEEDPFQVDGLAGATITARGVSSMIEFWLSDHVYGKYLKTLKPKTSENEEKET